MVGNLELQIQSGLRTREVVRSACTGPLMNCLLLDSELNVLMLNRAVIHLAGPQIVG